MCIHLGRGRAGSDWVYQEVRVPQDGSSTWKIPLADGDHFWEMLLSTSELGLSTFEHLNL